MIERSPGEGRYAHLEREQRWIVAGVPADARWRCEILDRYIVGSRLRLRRARTADETVYKLGQKVRVVESDPELVKLTNTYLSAEEYDALSRLPAAVVDKTRWTASSAGVDVAIDEFHGHLRGLVLGETELSSDAGLLALPEFALRDVTHDDRFSGGALAGMAGAELADLLAEAASARRGG